MFDSIPPAAIAVAVLVGVAGFIISYEVRSNAPYYAESRARKALQGMLISAALVVGGIYAAFTEQIG